jgi:hypothetical protein
MKLTEYQKYKIRRYTVAAGISIGILVGGIAILCLTVLIMTYAPWLLMLLIGGVVLAVMTHVIAQDL